MRNYFFIFTITIISLSSSAMAISYGPFASYRMRWDFIDYSPKMKSVSESMNAGIGLVYDTAVAQDKLFNYRFNIGLYRSFAKEGIFSLKFDNTFGFGIVRNKSYRLWVGPQIGFGVSHKSWSINYKDFAYYLDNIYDLNIYLNDPFYLHGYHKYQRLSMTSIFITGGAVFGLNYHIGKNVSFCLDFGYRAGYIRGFYFRVNKYTHSLSANDYFGSPIHEIFINFAFIFRDKDDSYNYVNGDHRESNINKHL